MEGVKVAGAFGRLECNAEVDQFINPLQIAQRNKDALFRNSGSRLGLFFGIGGKGNPLCRLLSHNGGQGTGHKNENNRAIENAFIKQADRSAVNGIASHNAVPDKHGCQSNGGMSAYQAIHKVALIVGEAEDFSG